MDEITLARFWGYVDKSGPIHPVLGTRCWIWIGSTVNGYGQFGLNGKTERAHRISWFLKYGKWPIPCCLHKCDNRPCVRPSHLFEGTKKDNTADMLAKGRHISGVKGRPELAAHGEEHSCAKLTDAKVLEIRRRYAPRIVTLAQLANEFRVSITVVYHVVHHMRWKHLE